MRWRALESAPLSEADGERLIDVACQSIRHGLTHNAAVAVDAAGYPRLLRQRRASFVTIKRHGRLRGCVGGLEARWALVNDVARHAYSAAFEDERFAPMEESELDDLDLHVSILGPRLQIQFDSEEKLMATLQPGLDGLLIEQGSKRATFLPSVWSTLPLPQQFLNRLKTKANIDAGECYLAWRYRVEEFSRNQSDLG